MKKFGIALLCIVYAWMVWITAQGVYVSMPPQASHPNWTLTLTSPTGTITLLAECDTDTDCQEKYPCGSWYGNGIYDQDMTPKEMLDVYERCMDEREGIQE